MLNLAIKSERIRVNAEKETGIWSLALTVHAAFCAPLLRLVFVPISFRIYCELYIICLAFPVKLFSVSRSHVPRVVARSVEYRKYLVPLIDS